MTLSTNTRIWLHGLGASFVGAIGTSIGTIAVAPDRFNLTSVPGLKNVVLSSIISGISAVGLYLSKSPVPFLTVQVSQQSTKTADSQGVTETSTKETTVQQ